MCFGAARSLSLSLFSQIRLSRVGQLSCPVSCGAVLVGKLSLGDFGAEEARGVVSRLAASPASAALSGMTTLQQVLDAAADGVLPPVLHVTTEASGTYVEFDVPRPAAAPSAGGAALPATALPARPRDLESTVAPVCWFSFRPMGGATRRFGAPPPPPPDPEANAGEPPAPPRPEKMVVDLRKHHAGNVCIVRLLSAENLVRNRGRC